MNPIRIKTHLDSETLHLPELKSLVGMDVEIIVHATRKAKTFKKKQNVREGWFARNFGRGWPGRKNDGFENTVREWRRNDAPRELVD